MSFGIQILNGPYIYLLISVGLCFQNVYVPAFLLVEVAFFLIVRWCLLHSYGGRSRFQSFFFLGQILRLEDIFHSSRFLISFVVQQLIGKKEAQMERIVLVYRVGLLGSFSIHFYHLLY